MVLPYAPLATMSTFTLDLLCTYAPMPSGSPVAASVCVAELMVGITVVGTVAVNRAVFSPTTVLPFFVMHLMVIVPLVVFGMLFASEIGIVQD